MYKLLPPLPSSFAERGRRAEEKDRGSREGREGGLTGSPARNVEAEHRRREGGEGREGNTSRGS